MTDLDDDEAARLRTTIDRQKRALAKQRQKLAEYDTCKMYLKLL
jgi:hypothetical protein